MKKSMRELLERSFCGDEVIAYIEELEKNNTLLEKEKKALADDNEMKCELNHELSDENKRLKLFKNYFDELYGKNLEVANWHLNGNLEPFDNFYEDAIGSMEDE